LAFICRHLRVARASVNHCWRLIYNSASGEGALGELSGNQFQTTKTYPKDAFARGFTQVVCAADPH
jgi:hypothetical protein